MSAGGKAGDAAVGDGATAARVDVAQSAAAIGETGEGEVTDQRAVGDADVLQRLTEVDGELRDSGVGHLATLGDAERT